MSHLIKIYAVCKFSYFCLWLTSGTDTSVKELMFRQGLVMKDCPNIFGSFKKLLCSLYKVKTIVQNTKIFEV